MIFSDKSSFQSFCFKTNFLFFQGDGVNQLCRMNFFIAVVVFVFLIFGLTKIRTLFAARRRDQNLWKKLNPLLEKIEQGEPAEFSEIQALADFAPTRLLLWQVLEGKNLQQLFPEKYATQEAGARANLCYQLLSKDELNGQPDLLELWENFEFDMPSDAARKAKYFVFKWNMQPPHWVSQTGWRVAVVGPYFSDTPHHKILSKLENYFTPIGEKTLAEFAATAHAKFLTSVDLKN